MPYSWFRKRNQEDDDFVESQYVICQAFIISELAVSLWWIPTKENA